MDKNVEITQHGLKCDNPKCDWKDDSIAVDTYKEWINKPCPKCGENLLTQEDYDRSMSIHGIVDFINALTPEQMKELTGGISEEEALQLLKDFNIDGANEIKGDDVVLRIGTHNKIKMNLENDNKGDKPKE